MRYGAPSLNGSISAIKGGLHCCHMLVITLFKYDVEYLFIYVFDIL